METYFIFKQTKNGRKFLKIYQTYDSNFLDWHLQKIKSLVRIMCFDLALYLSTCLGNSFRFTCFMIYDFIHPMLQTRPYHSNFFPLGVESLLLTIFPLIMFLYIFSIFFSHISHFLSIKRSHKVWSKNINTFLIDNFYFRDTARLWNSKWGICIYKTQHGRCSETYCRYDEISQAFDHYLAWSPP